MTDIGGLSDEAATSILVGTTPVPTITSPTAGFLFQANNTLAFTGNATDAEDGSLLASALTWTFSFYQASIEDPNNINLRNRQTFPGIATGTYSLPDWEYPVFLVVDLTATDSTGLTGTSSLRIDPQTADLTFVTNPAGLTANLNGRTAAAPFVRTLVVGSVNTIGVASPQTLGTSSYVFNSWSDGGRSPTSLRSRQPRSPTRPHSRRARPPCRAWSPRTGLRKPPAQWPPTVPATTSMAL